MRCPGGARPGKHGQERPRRPRSPGRAEPPARGTARSPGAARGAAGNGDGGAGLRGTRPPLAEGCCAPRDAVGARERGAGGREGCSDPRGGGSPLPLGARPGEKHRTAPHLPCGSRTAPGTGTKRRCQPASLGFVKVTSFHFSAVPGWLRSARRGPISVTSRTELQPAGTGPWHGSARNPALPRARPGRGSPRPALGGALGAGTAPLRAEGVSPDPPSPPRLRGCSSGGESSAPPPLPSPRDQDAAFVPLFIYYTLRSQLFQFFDPSGPLCAALRVQRAMPAAPPCRQSRAGGLQGGGGGRLGTSVRGAAGQDGCCRAWGR